MKAAVFRGTGHPLEISDVPTPAPGPGEALVRVAACGLCHTDLHYIDHGVRTFKTPPLILGHEASGTIAALGPGVEAWSEGDPVLIPAVLSCGKCVYCRAGRENLCRNLAMLGNHIDGAYAEYITVPASELVRVPPGLALDQVCVVADAVSTPYHAVTRRGRVRPGQAVAVVGCGGVGLNAVQCAVVAGASVIAVDKNEARLSLARELGAAQTFNPDSVSDPERELRRLSDGGVDVAFEAVGSAATVRLAFAALKPGGRLVVIGYLAAEVALSAARLMFFELEIVGSLGCGAGEYPEILRLVQAGKIKLAPVVSGTLPLGEINDGLERLRRGEGVRWVVTP
ncbi:MAG: alcohol dehydrogenase [Gemmatimonadales bacterium]|nr:MAG: alcohol dehydrogenase [Gemmatimonadales bacterium]